MGVLDHLTIRQRQAITGGVLLAMGFSAGVLVTPSDPQREQKLADIASRAGSAAPLANKPVDTAEYHRAMLTARAGRPDLVDILTAPVAPGAVATADFEVALGSRPQESEFVGSAVGRFDLTCQGCGLSFADEDNRTIIRLRARNASSETVRLVALVRLSSP